MASSPATKTDQKAVDTRRRNATVYDAVAGHVGPNGFLTEEQISSDTNKALKPEDVILRRVNAPAEIPHDYYNAHTRLSSTQRLPDSDLLKDIHTYVSDFYERTNSLGDTFDFKSLDETALLAMGILLEEACKECIGEAGDMVFTEPKLNDWEEQEVSEQVWGRVMPEKVQEYFSEESDREVVDVQPRKRRRRRYDEHNEV